MSSIPAGITVPVAADILFIGKAVRVLRKPGGSFTRQELLPAEDVLAATEAFAKLQDRPSFSQIEFEQMVEQVMLLRLSKSLSYTSFSFHHYPFL